MTSYLDTFSDAATPPSTSLHRNDGSSVRVVDANEAPLMRDLHISKPEFVQVKTRDGFVMEAMMIKPPNFDPSKKYPVYEHTYSGPHAQQVRNAWGGSTYLWHQFLAQHGVIVWVCDNRSASGKGMESAWTSYKRMGEGELRDLEDGLKWLESQPYVDASRVLLSGWSYGGFMTSYALTHSTMWSAGISGGTVSDWRDYDSIYTERVMLMPQNNPEGYKATAPRWAAKDLARKHPPVARHDRRQRSHAEHDSVHLRAGEGEQAVSAAGLSEVAPRRRRSRSRRAHARRDVEVHPGEPRREVAGTAGVPPAAKQEPLARSPYAARSAAAKRRPT